MEEMCKKIFLGILFVSFCVAEIAAQGIKIVYVKESVSGSDAFHAPLDNNGHPCGLIKVLSTFPDLQFEGNIVGEVSFENNEYKIFLAKGTSNLKVKRPQILPTLVNFSDYGITEIASKATYTIKVKNVTLKSEKCLLTMDVKPRDTKVFIDDVPVDNDTNNGVYSLLLQKGEHVCKLESKGYRSHVSIVRTGKGTQNLSIELESLLADVEVNSQTSGVHIYINGEDMGIGSWRGKLPAGRYRIEAQLEGYLPIEKTIEVVEKDNKVLNIPQMKRAKVNLSVLTNINEADVYLDGIKVSNPKNIPNLQIGKHNIKVKVPFGYKDVEKDVTLSNEQDNTVNINLEPLNELYAKAFSGDIDAQVEICHQKIESAKYNTNDSVERNFWYEKIYENFDRIKDESLDKLFYYEAQDLRGIYEYFKEDHEKGLRILQKWNSLGHYEFEKVAWHYYYLGKFEEAIRWGTKAIPYPLYECCFYDVIEKACSKLNDIEEGVSIMINTITNKWIDEAKFALFEGIGDLYKKYNKCAKALPYYKKCINLLQGLHYSNWVKDKITGKIMECQ